MVINPIVGIYIPIITIPIEGEMTIPNIGSLDPGTHGYRVPTSGTYIRIPRLWGIRKWHQRWFVLVVELISWWGRVSRCLQTVILLAMFF